MASQNTVSRNKLTSKDRDNLNICKEIVNILLQNIPDQDSRNIFYKEYGVINESRDAGQGRAAGKLQRDALTTRGKQAKAPFSNRNLRWHPLVIADICPSHFHPIEEINVNTSKLLLFTIEGKIYTPEDVYKLQRPYCIATDKWLPIKATLRSFSMDDWIKNWCTIPAAEYCTSKDAIESFAVLGINIACGFFNAKLEDTYAALYKILEELFPKTISLPECNKNLFVCPLCLSPINTYPCGLASRQRPKSWKPSWQNSKRGEGEDESLQLTHVEPLQEDKICHTAKLTRYGHRWCNVAMTDHSIENTVIFMEAVCKKHKKSKEVVN